MQKLKDILNVTISVVLIAFIATSFFRIVYFYLHSP
jgi:hypothetical protein